jgi:hypothetical protein
MAPAGTLTHLYEIVVRRAEWHPDTVALGGQDGLLWRTLSSQELLTLVDRLAHELAARGVREDLLGRTHKRLLAAGALRRAEARGVSEPAATVPQQP